MVVLSLFQSKAFLQTAASLASHMYEPHFNLSILSDKVKYQFNCSKPNTVSSLLHKMPKSCFVSVQIGDLQSSYTAAQKSEDSFPEHVDTQQLLKQLREHFAVL